MKNLQDSFKYFTDNHSEIFKLYPDQFVVIKDKCVLFAEKTFDGALERALKQGLVAGSFLIQQCTAGDSAYTQTFHSRAIFA